MGDVEREGGCGTDDEPAAARSVEVHPERGQPERHGDDDVGPPQQGQAAQHPGQSSPAVPPGTAEAHPVVAPTPDPHRRRADGERRQAQRQGSVPGERGQSGGPQQDDRRRDGRSGRDAPTPRPQQGVHGERDGGVLGEADQALDGEMGAEDLVQPGQEVERARTIEMQEVPIGEVAAEDLLGEREHEPLLHRRPGRPQQPPQGEHQTRYATRARHHQSSRRRGRPCDVVTADPTRPSERATGRRPAIGSRRCPS